MENKIGKDLMYQDIVGALGGFSRMLKFMKRDNITEVRFLGNIDASWDQELKEIPDNYYFEGNLNLFNCRYLTRIGSNVTICGNLDIGGCVSLKSIGENVKLGGFLMSNPETDPHFILNKSK